jgi:hypothetical protein
MEMVERDIFQLGPRCQRLEEGRRSRRGPMDEDIHPTRDVAERGARGDGFLFPFGHPLYRISPPLQSPRLP